MSGKAERGRGKVEKCSEVFSLHKILYHLNSDPHTLMPFLKYSMYAFFIKSKGVFAYAYLKINPKV